MLAVLLSGGVAQAQAPPVGELPSGLIDPEGQQEALERLLRNDEASEMVATGGVRGQLRAVRRTVLAAGLGGRIDAFPVTLGQAVSEGDQLLEMDCRERRAALAVAEAEVAAAQTRNDVNQQLAEANNVSLLEVGLAAAALDVARARRQQVRAQLAFCRITAPFAGVVTAKLVEAYSHVQPGQPVLELVDNSQLEVEVAVPSGWLAEGVSTARFTLVPDETGSPLTGQFVRSAGAVDPVSQTIRLIGQLDDPPAGLLAGMSGRIQVERR